MEFGGMADGLSGRSFVSMKDLSGEEIVRVMDTADALKRDRKAGKLEPLLAGRTLAMIFQKPSLRTRVSFETGMTLLGGHAIYLAPTDIKLGQRESTEDIAIVVSRFADIIMARTFGHEIVEELARHATCPVINGLSDREHPCQILADLQTVRERRGRLRGLRMVYVGDGNNVAHSMMYGCARVGMSLTVATPKGYEPDAGILAESQAMAEDGARIEVSNDAAAAGKGADVFASHAPRDRLRGCGFWEADARCRVHRVPRHPLQYAHRRPRPGSRARDRRIRRQSHSLRHDHRLGWNLHGYLWHEVLPRLSRSHRRLDRDGGGRFGL